MVILDKKAKEMQEKIGLLDMAFLAMYQLCIEKGYFTKEEFDSQIEKIEKGEKEDETGNEDIHN